MENRARFVLDIVRAIRDKVGSFHLQMKINGMDHNDWLYPWEKKGNSLAETIEICNILEDDGHGVDAFHVSSGSTFPHPRNPPGDIPIDEARRWYDVMRSSGVRAKLNDFIFSNRISRLALPPVLAVAARPAHRGDQRRLRARGEEVHPRARSLHRRVPARQRHRRGHPRRVVRRA